MSNGAVVGLGVDLSAFREGMRDAQEMVRKALSGDAAKGIHTAVMAAARDAREAWRGVGNTIKNVFGDIRTYLAALGIGAAIAKIKGELQEAYETFHKFEDSGKILEAALQTLPEHLRGAFDPEAFAGFRENMRLAFGVAGTELNGVVADFITRGFDAGQAQQLSQLAASYAQKTGKPLAEVSKIIADAASGNVKSMKDLGISISATGDKVRDAEAAVLAMKQSYGDIGVDLVDPSDRLRANIEELYVTLGEKLAPVLDPLIQGVADFVTGLMKTEEGKAMLDDLVESVRFVIDWFRESAIVAEGVGRIIAGVAKQVSSAIIIQSAGVASVIAEIMRLNPIYDVLFGLGGVDLEQVAKESRELAKASIQGIEDGIKETMKGIDIVATGKGSALAETSQSLISGGRIAREAGEADMKRRMEATKGETFASRTAHEEEARKREEAAAKEKEKREREEERAREKMASQMEKREREEERAREKMASQMEKRLERQMGAMGRGSFGPGTGIILAQKGNNPFGGRPARG